MASGTDSRSKVPAVLAVTLFALAMAELVTAITVAVTAGMSFGDAARGFVVTNGAMGLAFPACGVLLAWQRPRNPIGWLFLGAGIAHATSAVAAALLAPGLSSGWSPGAVRLLGTAFVFAWPWSIGVFVPVALLLFPDGRPTGRRWRWLPWAAVAEGLLFVASFATPGPQPIGRRIVSPYLTIPVHSQLAPLWAVGNVAWASIIAAAVASLVIRYRRGGDTERRQLLWLLLAALGVLAYAGIPWGIFGAGPILGLLVVPLIPVAVTIAILRYQLLDIRLVVSRTLLYGALTAGLAGIYAGLVALLDVAVRSRVSLGSAVVASIVIAFGFGPARARLQRLIDRALYGDRSDPVRAVSRVGGRLADGGAAGLPGVVEALCESLRLPFACIRSADADVAAYGTPPGLVYRTSLYYDGARVGELVVGLRPGQHRPGQADIAVLELLAGPLAVALHAIALSAALQESRLSIITAREEERLRIKRDLHDGLGPALTGVAFKADAARNVLPEDSGRAAVLLGELRADTTQAIADIRRLVYGLRPPALDDLGLVGSLRQHSTWLASRKGPDELAPLLVRIDAPEDFPTLPAAVEVAAYRIVTEAITNAIRHSGGTAVDVRLAVADGTAPTWLRIEITDNGRGTGADWQPGIGLASMRERAAELGGTCQAGPDPVGGARVTALLPLDNDLIEPRRDLVPPGVP